MKDRKHACKSACHRKGVIPTQCPHCNKEIKIDEPIGYCPFCGKKLTSKHKMSAEGFDLSSPEIRQKYGKATAITSMIVGLLGALCAVLCVVCVVINVLTQFTIALWLTGAVFGVAAIVFSRRAKKFDYDTKINTAGNILAGVGLMPMAASLLVMTVAFISVAGNIIG